MAGLLSGWKDQVREGDRDDGAFDLGDCIPAGSGARAMSLIWWEQVSGENVGVPTQNKQTNINKH